jgi:hypothetical protein
MTKVTLLLSCAAAAIISSGAASAGEVTASNLVFTSDEAAFFSTYTYAADDIVGSLNSITETAALWGHDRLGLAESSSGARLGYVLAAGFATGRVQWANSLFFGHEYVHHQNQHRFGLTDHYFTEELTGELISNVDAYKNILLHSEVGGPATSRGEGAVNNALRNAEGNLVSGAGLNWQMRYSNKLVRDAYAGELSVFRAQDLITNRAYMMLYALGDIDRAKDGGFGGDVYKFASVLATGDETPNDVLDDIVITSAISTALSPGFWGAVGSYSTYVSEAKTMVTPYRLKLGSADLTWDIPNYMNLDSYTVKPTFYLNVPTTTFDGLTLGLGLESSVIGEEAQEIELFTSFSKGKIGFEGALYVGDEGSAFEYGMTFDVTETVSLKVGGLNQNGDTLAGDRLAPEGNSFIFAGVSVKF